MSLTSYRAAPPRDEVDGQDGLGRKLLQGMFSEIKDILGGF